MSIAFPVITNILSTTEVCSQYAQVAFLMEFKHFIMLAGCVYKSII